MKTTRTLSLMICLLMAVGTVQAQENIKRAKLLRILRSNGRDPRKMSYGELREIFRKYRFEEPEKIMEADMTQHREI